MQPPFTKEPRCRIAEVSLKTISVVVLNYNRRDMLKECISAALQLDPKPVEVIVVDNASTDGSIEMTRAEFGQQVRLITRTVNCPTAGRNEGFAAATGDYILSIDNDIVLVDRSILAKALRIFTDYTDADILACSVGDESHPGRPVPEHWWHPISAEKAQGQYFYTDFFSEGAVFFRSSLLRRIGGYDEEFVQYGESKDLALRAIAAGAKILCCPDLYCSELYVRYTSRRTDRVNHLTFRNKLWILWKHYPAARAVSLAAGKLLLTFAESIKEGWTKTFFRAAKDGMFAPSALRNKRAPLSSAVWNRIAAIRAGVFAEPTQHAAPAQCVKN
jgi:hypothetical protein